MQNRTRTRDWSQHSRLNRCQRKLEQSAELCQKIDYYFPVIPQMERLLAENQELRRKLVLSMGQVCSSSSNIISLPNCKLLELLLECAKSNADKKPNGRNYNSIIKEFGTLCFVMGGPQLYGIFSSSLGLPSISTCRRNLQSNDRLEECYFRIAEAKEYLLKRNVPTKVVICEDGTRVNGRIQYDSKTNQIVGLVPPLENGIPKLRSFPATSAELIKQYFETGVVSSNAYVIMLQPLANNAAPFCLALFGTDNRFDASSVDLRWKWMAKAFSDVGRDVVAFSADGDPKLLSAMVSRTFSHSPPDKWPWFKATLNTDSPVCVQETTHIIVKLKSKLLKPSEVIPMGKRILASRGHLVELISNVSKDQHELTNSFIDVKDKMNYRAAQKICDAKVTKLLRQSVPESEGTATYLDMMRDVAASYLEPALDTLDRIKLLWKWIFFLRIWRQWIQSNQQYSLSHNFISLNSYTCLEINANALIKLARLFRDLEMPHLFLIWLFSSQANEKFFRKARSITGVESTVINFSILEFVSRIHRIDFLGESQLNLKDIVKFPSLQKSFKDSANSPPSIITLPEDYEIENVMKEAFQWAREKCTSLGMAKKTTTIPSCPLSSQDIIDPNNDDAEIDELIGDSELDDCETPNETDGGVGEDGELEDIMEDLVMVTSGLMGLKTYNDANVTPESPFVRVLDGTGFPCIIKKISLCWLLSSGDTKMSSDRLLRVQTSTNSYQQSARSPPASKPSCEDEVSIGDWCAFTSETGNVCIGRIMAFSYMSGFWRQQEYSLLTARGVGCLCSWFTIGKNGKLIPANMDTQGYYNIEKYICTGPRPRTMKSNLMMSCPLSEIKKFAKVNLCIIVT